MARKLKSTRKSSTRRGSSRSSAAKRKPSRVAKSKAGKRARGAKKATKKVVRKATKKAPKKAVKKATKKAAKKAVKKAPRGKAVKKAVAVRADRRPGANRTAAASNDGLAKGRASTAKRDKVASASRRSATSQDPIQFREERPKLPKTHLNKKQLAEFKALLLFKRGELTGDVQNLTRDAYSKGGSSGEQSSMPIHMADLGSDNWEHEFTLGLIENEQGRIRTIDEALARIDEGTYGICLATHKRINVARLRAKPWAKYCIEYARAREEGRAL